MNPLFVSILLIFLAIFVSCSNIEKTKRFYVLYDIDGQGKATNIKIQNKTPHDISDEEAMRFVNGAFQGMEFPKGAYNSRSNELELTFNEK